MAKALRSHGYATSLFGKWHGGKPRGGRTDAVHPMDQGFDEFFGYTDAVKAWEKFPKTTLGRAQGGRGLRILRRSDHRPGD